MSDTLYKSLKIEEKFPEEINLHLDFTSLFEKILGNFLRNYPENLKNNEKNEEKIIDNLGESFKTNINKPKESKLKNLFLKIIEERNYTYSFNESEFLDMVN